MAPTCPCSAVNLGCLLIGAPGELSPLQKEAGVMEKTACILGVPGLPGEDAGSWPGPSRLLCWKRGWERPPPRAPPWFGSPGI